ncbi:hypothetical protein HG541_01560 [Proteus terrae subsp. cibarius]|uniref:hypothetical protein n=1 Tax=Proteus terrae TaxID=1574161 RepID=UPI0014954C69|nr:hypothetical protein [Proteus terrae]QKD68154.1 hypothetical protein HG541_01560 [Proteus terrae subsp. cibarius]QKD73308.1 hypothetical protein HG539_10855 [Proteus terrae subsp. cibarius]UDF25605.1 hypothetical protein LHA39_16085 [Proteus terrae subsp. cibarius]
MNINSIFRDTVNQLTTGAGKAINSVVDFFSSLRSGITGLFNSNTPFRFNSNDNESGKKSFNTLKDLLGSKCEINTIKDTIYKEIDGVKNHIYEEIDGVKNHIYEEIDGVKNHIYEEIDDVKKHIYEEIDDVKNHIYEEIDEKYLNLIRDSSKSGNEKEPLIVNGEYYVIFDCINISSEEVYSESYSNNYSDEVNYDKLLTDNEIMELWGFLLKDKTQINTI